LPFYDTQQMIDEILNMDIGLFPLFDVEDSRIRGFLKALVYMSGETAVVASPRGQIPELIQDGINGMLADSSSEWVEKLDLLINDAVLRKRIAAGGLETARRDFSLEKSFEGLLDALKLDAN
jgi:glycosyltransferase involved in cell wall biosynthesis